MTISSYNNLADLGGAGRVGALKLKMSRGVASDFYQANMDLRCI